MCLESSGHHTVLQDDGVLHDTVFTAGKKRSYNYIFTLKLDSLAMARECHEKFPIIIICKLVSIGTMLN